MERERREKQREGVDFSLRGIRGREKERERSGIGC